MADNALRAPATRSQPFSTPIPVERMKDYQGWLTQLSENLRGTEDYDLQGAFLAGAKPEGGHLTDQYKKPNHMTFSTESQYSGQNGNVGGRWVKSDGKWIFYASPTNLKYHSPEELQDYFRRVEPGNTLVLPQTRPASMEALTTARTGEAAEAINVNPAAAASWVPPDTQTLATRLGGGTGTPAGKVDYTSIAKQLGGGPAVSNEDERRTFLGFLENVVGSTGRAIGGLDPRKLVPALSALASDMSAKSGFAPVPGQPHDTVDKLIELYKQRYGSWDGFLKAAYEDPAGIALDMSMVLGGASGLARGGSALAQAGNLTRTAATLGRVADVAETASLATNPIGAVSSLGFRGGATAARGVEELANLRNMPTAAALAGKTGDVLQAIGEASYPVNLAKPINTTLEATDRLAEWTAQKLRESSLRGGYTVASPHEKVVGAAEAMRGQPFAQSTVQGAAQDVSTLQNLKEQILNQAQAGGAAIPTQDLVSELMRIRSKYDIPGSESHLAQVDDVIDSLVTRFPTDVPVAEAERIKELVNWKEGAVPPEIAGRAGAQLQLRSSIQQQIADAIPVVGEINKIQGPRIELAEALNAAINKYLNTGGFLGTFKKLGALGWGGGTAAGTYALTGNAVDAGLAGLTATVLSDPVVQARLAMGINKLQELNPARWGQPNVGNAMTQAQQMAQQALATMTGQNVSNAAARMAQNPPRLPAAPNVITPQGPADASYVSSVPGQAAAREDIAGYLGPGPERVLTLPPPADTSYVRSVQGTYPEVEQAFQAEKAAQQAGQTPASVGQMAPGAAQEVLNASKVGEATEPIAAGLDSIQEQLRSVGDAAMDRVRQTGALDGRIQSSLFPAEVYKDMVQWGAARVANGAIDFAKFSKAMLADAKTISPQAAKNVAAKLPELWEDAKKAYDHHVQVLGEGNIAELPQIMKFYKAGKEGKDWYTYVRPALEPFFGQHTELFLKMLAATSPNTNVTQNVNNALRAFRQFMSGEEFTGMPAHVDNLNRAVAGVKMSGPKVGAFGPNLLGDLNPVTVDLWMARAILGRETVTPLQSQLVDYMTSQAAMKVGLKPAEMQAAIWTGVKKLWKSKDTSAPPETIVQEYLDKNPAMRDLLEQSLKMGEEELAPLRSKQQPAKPPRA